MKLDTLSLQGVGRNSDPFLIVHLSAPEITIDLIHRYSLICSIADRSVAEIND
jgi:hypothetical protein